MGREKRHMPNVSRANIDEEAEVGTKVSLTIKCIKHVVPIILVLESFLIFNLSQSYASFELN